MQAGREGGEQAGRRGAGHLFLEENVRKALAVSPHPSKVLGYDQAAGLLATLALGTKV